LQQGFIPVGFLQMNFLSLGFANSLFRAGEAVKMLGVKGSAEEAKQWTLQDFEIMEEYVAAFATRQRVDNVSCYSPRRDLAC